MKEPEDCMKFSGFFYLKTDKKGNTQITNN